MNWLQRLLRRDGAKDIEPWRGGQVSTEHADNFVTNQVTVADYRDLRLAGVAVSLFAGGATLRLHRPVCEMILDPTSEPDMGDGLSMAPVSFSAVQKVA